MSEKAKGSDLAAIERKLLTGDVKKRQVLSETMDPRLTVGKKK